MGALMNWRVWLAVAAAAVLAYGGFRAGTAHVQAKWDKASLAMANKDVQAGINNARETLRRLNKQQENQRAQDKELAAARDDAKRNGADADKLRRDNAAIAKRWRDALRNSPTVEQLEAAGDAIGVLTDVLGRCDKRASLLADYADTARIAGLKCERDYDALTNK